MVATKDQRAARTAPTFLTRPRTLDDLNSAIRSKLAVVGVVGQGYVGFGLAQRAAEAGFETYGLDLQPAVVERSQRENSFDAYLATTDPTVLADCDVILIAVPTPTLEANGGRKSDLSLVEAAGRMVLDQIDKDNRPRLVVCESTYAPGTTRGLLAPIFAEAPEPDRIAVGYSPERIDPGNTGFPLEDIPKVTSGIDERSADLTRVFYEQIVHEVVPASSMEAAEATKLLENTFRFINIAFAQEFDEYCYSINLSSHEVTRLAATKPFGFMAFHAGAGVGGHCIAEDPYFLYDSMLNASAKTDVLQTAMKNHDSRSEVIVERIKEHLGGRSLEGARILVLGVAYKPNIGDTRRSPAQPVIAWLRRLGATVDYHDPHVPLFDGQASVDLDDRRPTDYDLAVAMVEHAAFDIEALRSNGWSVYRLSDSAALAPAARTDR
jgi:nucleotide sugar dehydrogenase